MSTSPASSPPDRRSRKRLATRQGISNIATQLFMERGFDQVTVDEIAEAADVGRMTVFNHFPRKEDLFFDRDEAGREILLETLRRRDAGTTPVEAFHQLARRLIAEKSPYIDFSARSQSFLETVEASETLKARARAIRDELAGLIAGGLATSAGLAADDPDARLTADLLVATWAAAFIEGHRTFRRTRSSRDAAAMFLAIIDKGTIGLKAAMADSPFA